MEDGFITIPNLEDCAMSIGSDAVLYSAEPLTPCLMRRLAAQLFHQANQEEEELRRMLA
jgi:hypothetical protein